MYRGNAAVYENIAEIAKKLHVSKSTYARYERGELIPPLWFLHQVAVFYGVSVGVLLSKELGKE